MAANFDQTRFQQQNGVPLYHVNAFTDNEFAGNPAAVCLLNTDKGDGWMQSMAAQMNLSETAFIQPLASTFARGKADVATSNAKSSNAFQLRWFTPTREVDLCGHATLASAHILWEQGYVERSEVIRFTTLSGVLTAAWKSGTIQLDFPATPAVPAEPPLSLLDGLGISPIYSAKFGEKYLLQVDNMATLLSITPDFSALMQLPERGVSVTCLDQSEKYDFASRYFAPWVGIDEDPVNGSSHCALAPFWRDQLGRQKLFARQASSRGGDLIVECVDERVKISGRALSVLKGLLL